MKILHEHMIKLTLNNWVTRVWWDAHKGGIMLPSNVIVTDHAQDWLAKNQGATKLDFAKSVLSLDNVNAVEVLDVFGNGEILYKDWP